MTASGDSSGSVQLADRSASTLLFNVLADAIRAFPADFEHVDIPDEPVTFRRTYADWLPGFEAARLASDNAAGIARHMVRHCARAIVWVENGEVRPLGDLLAEGNVAPLPLLRHQCRTDGPGWQPTVVYRAERYDLSSLTKLADQLFKRRVVSSAAASAMQWLARFTADQGGSLSLAGRKVVALGAGAEMAATRLFLEAGADVLWLDLKPPPEEWLGNNGLSGGRLNWASGGADLLNHPQEVLASILKFAEQQPVDLCLYAYAPGQAREMRLTGVMNAIVDAMPDELVRSVSTLVSPTTPVGLDPSDGKQIKDRTQQRPLWERALATVGLLGSGGGQAGSPERPVCRTVVGIQGTSYQAAQYLGKVLTAECWARFGTPERKEPKPIRVSANTAAITKTRSMAHPVFAAAFGGAAALGVETFTPRQSRTLNGLLTIHDWLNPAATVPGSIRVHGGIHTLPFPLESGLRIAAVIGFARSPRLLKGLLNRRSA